MVGVHRWVTPSTSSVRNWWTCPLTTSSSGQPCRRAASRSRAGGGTNRYGGAASNSCCGAVIGLCVINATGPLPFASAMWASNHSHWVVSASRPDPSTWALMPTSVQPSIESDQRSAPTTSTQRSMRKRSTVASVDPAQGLSPTSWFPGTAYQATPRRSSWRRA